MSKRKAKTGFVLAKDLGAHVLFEIRLTHPFWLYLHNYIKKHKLKMYLLGTKLFYNCLNLSRSASSAIVFSFTFLTAAIHSDKCVVYLQFRDSTMNYACSIFFFLFLAQGAAQNWQQLPNFPGNQIDDGVGFTIGDSAYFGTGLTPWFAAQSDFHGLNLATETWFAVAPLPIGEERQYATSFVSSTNKGYVFGGYNGTVFLNDLWQYNPTQNTWTELTPLPAFGRGGSCCFVLNDTAYVVGGNSDSIQATNQVWAYSILNDSWSQKSNLPFGGLWRASSTTNNNTGYVIFGRDEFGDFKNELLAYNPAQDSWLQVSTFPSMGRSHAAMFSFDTNLFVCFGMDSLGDMHNDLWRYTINTNAWQTLTGIPASARRGGIAVTSSNTFYYATGLDGTNQRLNETWKYVPSLSTEEWNLHTKKVLVKIVDLMGRETQDKPNTVLIYMYSDGSAEKVYRME